MSEWIESRVDAARTSCPVADAVASAIKEQLYETMRSRALRSAEQTAIAKSLLAMLGEPPAGDAKP